MLDLKKGAWQLNTLTRFVTRVFPLVDRELNKWKEYLETCPGGELKEQALASIRDKRFHCQGGSIFALYQPSLMEPLVSTIVAVQTISDYLDNLCDRAGCQEERAFRQLHQAIIHSLTPLSLDFSYYRYYTYGEDGGYLKALVRASREGLKNFPSYGKVQDRCVQLASLYSDLQVYKHLPLDVREEKLKEWFGRHRERFPPVHWWEFSAATGSTLGIFMLLAASGSEDLKEEEIEELVEAYFPWIGGLHILLDYFIDQQEDRTHRDLNFVSYYRGEEECLERLKYFLNRSLEKASRLPHPDFHRMVVKGLLAMYLSDPKVEKQGLFPVAQELLKESGPDSRGMYRFCKGLRQVAVL
ncbi:MAG: tetraprenyl-beta-curcumene synthase family protein [Candidatus Syntrophonatronum acetioxidans]|uniref:Tetraprenyl-beta-curcumene synthase family protein n=1 Tax=Candidatus Syntrophonatronum acetioxidans TaxID=1795816 RepID=A0A424YEU0_9FIRM|nr:MAG: tetraprenyl-beta-curcumene synthase family protein [Candidatus Syntrophonatronum acetioxidans]